MSIPTWYQVSLLTSNLPFVQHIGGGSIDWHFPITALINTLEIVGSTCLTKYNVHFMPGWPLQWWMDLIHLKSGLLIQRPWFGGSAVFMIKSGHLCSVLLSDHPFGYVYFKFLLRIGKQPSIIQPHLQLMLVFSLDSSRHWIFRYPVSSLGGWWPLPQCCPHLGLFIKLGIEIQFLYPDHSTSTWVRSREVSFTIVVDSTQHFVNIHPN